MTARRLLWFAPVLVLIVAALPVYSAPAKPATAPMIDQRAVDLMRQMADYMGNLQGFTVTIHSTRELLTPSELTLDSDLSFNVSVQRPDKLRVEMTSAAGGAQLFYDGKDLTVYRPAKNYYATTPAPPTIREAVQAAAKRGIVMPLADLIYSAPKGQLLKNVTIAKYVGTSMVDGTLTHQLAFRGKSVDWQVWIEDGPNPLPRRVVIVDRKVQGWPRYTATLSDWNVNPTFDASTFTFVPPEGAHKINFGELPKTPGTMFRNRSVPGK